MRWTVHIEGGPRRVNHAAVCVDGRIYSFGGYCCTEEYKDWDPIPVHVLNTETLRWSTVNYTKNDVIPFQRYGHTTVAYGDKIFMWGGRNDTVACDSLYCFDTRTLKWTAPKVKGMVPFAKDGHSACVIGNKMYTFGGFEYVSDQYSQEVYCLDLDTLEWAFVNTTGPAPTGRDFHTAVGYGNRMYIFGGRGDLNGTNQSDEELYCPQLYYLDTIQEKWFLVNIVGLLPQGRRSHSAWLYEDFIYIFGGYNGNTKQHLNSLYRYSIKENKWHLLELPGSVPCKRRRQACLIHKDKAYLFGGTSPCAHAPVYDAADRNAERLMDNSDLHVLDYSPTLKTLCILKVLENNLDQTCLPNHILLDINTMTLPNRISRAINPSG